MKTISLISFTVLLLCSNLVSAELKELDDKKLEDQKAKAGITIDLESQLYIGEVYWDTRGDADKQKQRKNFMPPKVDSITYDLPSHKR